MNSSLTRPDPKRDPHGKIHLDATLFKQHSERSFGGSLDCDHDWHGSLGNWTCALCGRVKTFEPW